MKLSATESLPAFIEAIRKVGVPEDKIRNVLEETNIRSTDKVELKVKWMRDQGIPGSRIGILIGEHPQILSYRLARHGLWYKKNGFTDIAGMFEKYPQAFGLKVKGNLSRKLVLLRHPWNLSTQDIQENPWVLGASFDRIKTITDWLKIRNFPFHTLSTSEKVAILVRGKLDNIFSVASRLSKYPVLESRFFQEVQAQGLIPVLFQDPGRLSERNELICRQIVSRLISDSPVFKPKSQQRIPYQRILTGK